MQRKSVFRISVLQLNWFPEIIHFHVHIDSRAPTLDWDYATSETNVWIEDMK